MIYTQTIIDLTVSGVKY